MRIAYISYELPPDIPKGGIGTYTLQVAELMSASGNLVHIFAGSPTRSVTEQIDGIIIHRIQCTSPEDFSEKLSDRFLKTNAAINFELVECPEIHHHAFGIKRALPNLPLIVRLHAPNYLVESIKKTYTPLTTKLRFVFGALRRGKFDLGFWRRYNYKNDSEYLFAQIASVITAPSETMKYWAIKNWKIDASKIVVISNPFTPPSALLDLPIHKVSANKRIVFFGRLNVLKGLVNATLAVKEILKQYPHNSFTVIGDDGAGPRSNITMRQWMQTEFEEVKTQVSFLDGQSYGNLPAALKDAEIALLPSLFESFSYTCAEAMAAGKAVIGSRNTGMEDMIAQHQNGILVNANSVTEIYKALNKLISDDEFRYRLALHARQDIATKYDGKTIGTQYRALYKRVAAKS